ncbi:hypothetical protein H4582DRAFT_403316 [Lactarius indigo]|nr:hypothetical protein H4582DRAFT_403316 [Lactarius indigo]
MFDLSFAIAFVRVQAFINIHFSNSAHVLRPGVATFRHPSLFSFVNVSSTGSSLKSRTRHLSSYVDHPHPRSGCHGQVCCG